MMPITDKGCYCFTIETIDTVDIFTRPMYKQLIVHSLNHFIDSKGLIVYGWSLMSNKLYMICQSAGNIPLKELRGQFIEFTSKKIVEAIKDDPSERNLWLLKHFERPAPFFDSGTSLSCWGDIKTTRQMDMQAPQGIAEQLEFMHSLPVKERIVQYAADYLYSSARDYSGLPGLVKITKFVAVERALYEIESRKAGFRSNPKSAQQ